MKSFFSLCFFLITAGAIAQNAIVSGQLIDEQNQPVSYANVALYQIADSTLAKVEVSNANGDFKLSEVASGNYFLVASFIGLESAVKESVVVTPGKNVEVGKLIMAASSIALEEASVVVERPLVEILSDRTVFNVEGTINNTGDNALNLMRKAPGVTVDNNDNVNVLGRSGVMLYVDGKRLPLSGEDLANYLRNLPSDQIDRMDIISNPGAKYDAEGNAGIIDIRLKKDKNLGANGSVQSTLTRGQKTRGNVNLTGNYRKKHFNAFGTLGASKGESFNNMAFDSYQNGLNLDETLYTGRGWQNLNYRLGTDFYIGKNHIIGFLANGMVNDGYNDTDNQIAISEQNSETIDSVLVALSHTDRDNTNQSYNINYRYDNRDKKRSFNVDLDYGSYDSEVFRTLPNVYYDASFQNVLTVVNNWFETPSDIDIYTAKADFESQLFGGSFGAGAKFSQVISDNTFIVYDEGMEEDTIDDIVGVQNRDDTLSNIFKYDEIVYAVYAEYKRQINNKWSFSSGLRVELTDAVGDLQAFLPELAEDPVDLYYLRWFPNVGFTYQRNPMNVYSLNYGRRINRPDYNVLNPFNNQLSQISYEKGNPRLQPEIVNNIELGYTYQYRFNFKLAYSKTLDQITRLIGPDDTDLRASFVTWDNLAEQTIWSFNASMPMTVTPKWSTFVNLGGSRIDNQADYGEDGFVDIQAWTYNIYTQNTFTLPKGFKGEISGYFSGPGVWGGVFLYNETWSLNLGLSKKFFKDQLSVRVTANDIFYESGWDGVSSFNGLVSAGNGNWDSRYVSLSVGYNFGNQNVKSRKRSTGLENEAERVGG